MTVLLTASVPALGGLPVGCLFHSVTGLWCPLCGGTRATLSMLDGDWAAVPGWNPYAPVVELLMAAVLVRLGYRLLQARAGGRPALSQPVVSGREALVFMAVSMVFMVLRNLPVLQPLLAARLGPPTTPIWG